jgi:SAM-dependent methyltransferase
MKENLYRAQWDAYVKQRLQTHPSEWPGDEWGDEEYWLQLFQKMFIDVGAGEWHACVEIGPGSGKYTNYLLRNSDAQITAFDISPAYLDVLKRRLSQDIIDARLDPVVIHGEMPDEILKYLGRKNLIRKIDAFFSIDAMVHVDLQYLMAYLITACLSLKENGYLILTVANATSVSGFAHLVECIKVFYPQQGKPSWKFEHLSPEIVEYVLQQLGFTVEFVPIFATVEISRDLHVIAKLTDTARADGFRHAIC